MKLEPIKVELVETNVFTRWPCYVCGGCTEKVPILAEGPGVRVCESCLEDGIIDAKLERTAAELELHAKETRDLIGRLQVPTFAEYEARTLEYEAERAARRDRCDKTPWAYGAALYGRDRDDFDDVSIVELLPIIYEVAPCASHTEIAAVLRWSTNEFGSHRQGERQLRHAANLNRRQRLPGKPK